MTIYNLKDMINRIIILLLFLQFCLNIVQTSAECPPIKNSVGSYCKPNQQQYYKIIPRQCSKASIAVMAQQEECEVLKGAPVIFGRNFEYYNFNNQTWAFIQEHQNSKNANLVPNNIYRIALSQLNIFSPISNRKNMFGYITYDFGYAKTMLELQDFTPKLNKIGFQFQITETENGFCKILHIATKKYLTYFQNHTYDILDDYDVNNNGFYQEWYLQPTNITTSINATNCLPNTKTKLYSIVNAAGSGHHFVLDAAKIRENNIELSAIGYFDRNVGTVFKNKNYTQLQFVPNKCFPFSYEIRPKNDPRHSLFVDAVNKVSSNKNNNNSVEAILTLANNANRSVGFNFYFEDVEEGNNNNSTGHVDVEVNNNHCMIIVDSINSLALELDVKTNAVRAMPIDRNNKFQHWKFVEDPNDHILGGDYRYWLEDKSVTATECDDDLYYPEPLENLTCGCKYVLCHRCNSQCLGCNNDSTNCKRCRNFSEYKANGNQMICHIECPPHKRFPDENKTCLSRKPFIFDWKMAFGTALGLLILILIIVLAISFAYWYRKKFMVLNILNKPEIEEVEPNINAIPNMNILRIIKENEIRRGSSLGNGHFGTVYKGYWIPENEGVSIPIAIKVLNNKDLTTEQEFLLEAQRMAVINHVHLMSLIGIVMSDHVMLITALMPLGSLEIYIKKHMSEIGSKAILTWCTQIASGMDYLEKHRFVHRDLAARNVLVKKPLHVCITDFGLAKLIDYNKREYLADGKESEMPIRRCAIESLTNGVFTSKTDIWAFGVTVWEILSMCEMPYNNIPNRNLLNYLQSGGRLAQPIRSSIELYTIQLNCWLSEPQSRPTFAQLKQEFKIMSRDPARYVFIENDKDRRLPDYSPVDQKEFLNKVRKDSDDILPEGLTMITADTYLVPDSLHSDDNRSSKSYESITPVFLDKKDMVQKRSLIKAPISVAAIINAENYLLNAQRNSMGIENELYLRENEIDNYDSLPIEPHSSNASDYDNGKNLTSDSVKYSSIFQNWRHKKPLPTPRQKNIK